MTALSPQRPGLLRLVWDHNPFYLFSAACMLASCLALTKSMTSDVIPTRRILVLIGTLNLYEFALIGLALFLIKSKGLLRDGRMLLIIQAFFLVDVAFLNAEVIAEDFRTGVIVNSILFTLAAVKMYWVVRVLKPAFSSSQFAVVVGQLLILFLIPLNCGWIGELEISPLDFYAMWWFVGLLPVAYDLAIRFGWIERPAYDASIGTMAAPTRLYVLLPWLSMLLHLGILHYVYDVRFYLPDAAPVLLGLTVLLNQIVPKSDDVRRELNAVRVALPAVALMISVSNPPELALPIAAMDYQITALRATLVGAYLIYVYCFFLRYAIWLLSGGLVVVLAGIFGPSPSEIASGFDAGMRALARFIRRLIPSTTTQWGIVGIVASFASLIIGGWVSLRRAAKPILVVSEQRLTDK
jgi:hypothetical protein